MLELSATWVPTQAEFNAFAEVSGDDNAIHVDEEFSARTAFGRTVSHGMLIYSKLWGLLQQHRPGARQISQSLMFPNPTFTGEEITLSVVETEPGRLSMRAVRVSDGAEVLIGETEVTQ
jgi:acyl dehydratase